MASRRRRRFSPGCRTCRLEQLPEEMFYRGLCPACMDVDKRRRHAATGACLLAKAKDAGTVERDGQTFTVVVLPPKRRGGRRIR